MEKSPKEKPDSLRKSGYRRSRTTSEFQRLFEALEREEQTAKESKEKENHAEL